MAAELCSAAATLHSRAGVPSGKTAGTSDKMTLPEAGMEAACGFRRVLCPKSSALSGIAKHPARERAGLALQGGHQVPVVDVARMAYPVTLRHQLTAQHPLATQPALDVLGVLTHPQAVADQLARRARLLAFDLEDRVLADACRQLFVLGGSTYRQRLEHRPLDRQPLGDPGVEALHVFAPKQLVAGAVFKAARAAQSQCLGRAPSSSNRWAHDRSLTNGATRSGQQGRRNHRRPRDARGVPRLWNSLKPPTPAHAASANGGSADSNAARPIVWCSMPASRSINGSNRLRPSISTGWRNAARTRAKSGLR